MAETDFTTTQNFLNTTLGASGTNIGDITRGALAPLIQRALRPSTVSDNTLKNLALLQGSLRTIAEASKPGATGLGAISTGIGAGAKDYLDRQKVQRVEDLTKLSTGLSLLKAQGDTTKPFSVTAKEDVLIRGKNVPAGKSTLITQGEFARLPNDIKSKLSLASEKKDSEKLQPYGVVDTDLMRADPLFTNLQISANGNVLLNEEDAKYANKKGFIIKAYPPQIAGFDKDVFGAIENQQNKLAPALKAHKEVQRAYENIKGFYDNEDAISDYGLAVGFAKILDPTSVARESEVQSVASAGSITASLKAQIINALLGTGKLSKGIRKQIYNATIKIYADKTKRFNKVIDGFKSSADKLAGAGASDEKKQSAFEFIAPGFTVKESPNDIMNQQVDVTDEDKNEGTGLGDAKIIINPQVLKRVTKTFLLQLIQNAEQFKIDDAQLKLIEKELDSRDN